MMSVFHNGRLRTMKAHYLNGAGDVRIIRPFIYVRERQTREFAENNHLPIITENCPACFEGPKERYRIKSMIAQQEHLFPDLISKMLSAMAPLMKDASWKKLSTKPSDSAAAIQGDDGDDDE